MQSDQLFEKIYKLGVIPVVVLEDADKANALGDALVAGGLPIAEVTFRTAAAEAAITQLAKRDDLLIGAGTVLSPEQVDRAVDAGAEFLVSPGLNPQVVEHAQKREVPITPGVVTPTEIERAMSLGLHVLKFFPAEAMGGVKVLKALSAPYSSVRFIPTGGVNTQNLESYLDMPKVLACGGSWMVDKSLVVEGQFDQITERAMRTVALVKQAGR